MKVKIKNNRKNIFFVIFGRIATFILLYVGIIKMGLVAIEYIVNNCITTL